MSIGAQIKQRIKHRVQAHAPAMSFNLGLMGILTVFAGVLATWKLAWILALLANVLLMLEVVCSFRKCNCGKDWVYKLVKRNRLPVLFGAISLFLIGPAYAVVGRFLVTPIIWSEVLPLVVLLPPLSLLILSFAMYSQLRLFSMEQGSVRSEEVP
jgi:hypothetical protein